jgi:hypothetical protein
MEPNIAAWMIAGGRNAFDPDEIRDRAHRAALATAYPKTPFYLNRVVSAALATLRPATAPAEPACCPA